MTVAIAGVLGQTRMLDLQTNVNASVVNALVDDLDADEQAALRKKPTTMRVRGSSTYARGWCFNDRFTLGTLDGAIALLQEAIERDPGFALAYAALADVHQSRQQIAHLSSEEGFGTEQRYLDEALRPDPKLTAAQSLAAMFRDHMLWDPNGGLRLHLRAFELDPNLPEA